MNLQGSTDPVTLLINKLSSGQDLTVKIQRDTDGVILENNKKLMPQPLRIDLSSKVVSFPKIQKICTLFSNKRSPQFPTEGQKYILEKLKQIPIYTVVNGNNEMIMASPRKSVQETSLDWLRDKYTEIFSWTHDEGPITVGLFFMNKQDAESYLHEICKKETRESEILGLKIKTIGLDVFYRFNRTSPPKVQSKLIADLQEIEFVLSKYMSKFFCNINPKQKYSKNWFQGNPIYILKLTKSNSKKLITQYQFHNQSEKKIVFFSREDAIRAWNVYSAKHPELHLPSEPNLELYNLENFLNDLEISNKDNMLDLVLVPPYNSYISFKSKTVEQDKPSYSYIEKQSYNAKLQLKNIQRFYKGLVWLLTSDTLPSEENSW
jgi:hypothetical protein